MSCPMYCLTYALWPKMATTTKQSRGMMNEMFVEGKPRMTICESMMAAWMKGKTAPPKMAIVNPALASFTF